MLKKITLGITTLVFLSFSVETITDVSTSVSDNTELFSVWYDATNQTGYIGSINRLYKTTDGVNWTAIDLSTLFPGNIQRIIMLNNTTGFILGTSGVFYTNDGFATINRATMDVTTTADLSVANLGLTDMDLLPPCAVVSSSSGNVYLSWDGGYSYLPVNIPEVAGYTINGIAAIGCSSYSQEIPRPPNEPITYSVYVIDFALAGGKILNFGGYEGVIASVKCTVDTFYYTSTCEVWNFRTFPGEYFYGLYRFDGEYYAVGENGGIFRSTDTISWQRTGVSMYNALFVAFKRSDGKVYFGGQNIFQSYVGNTLVDNVSLVDNFTTTLNGAIYGIYSSFDANNNRWTGFAVGIKDTYQPLILKLEENTVAVTGNE